jgi:hypothetical protein
VQLIAFGLLFQIAETRILSKAAVAVQILLAANLSIRLFSTPPVFLQCTMQLLKHSKRLPKEPLALVMKSLKKMANSVVRWQAKLHGTHTYLNYKSIANPL